MADSPAKRRKTSPTTSIPIDAPTTPSRIPVSTARRDSAKTSARRPSFASPTKASLSRHNPQLLSRPSSSGPGSSSGRGRNLQDIFAKALGEMQPETQVSQSSNENQQDTQAGSTQDDGSIRADSQPKATGTPKGSQRSIGGRIATKPRRPSRSPVKRVERTPTKYADVDPTAGLPADFNPFKKKGLRRSPVPGQVNTPVQPEPQEQDFDPFRKTGLRRSPISSQPVASTEQSQTSNEAPVPASTTPTTLIPRQIGVADVVGEPLATGPQDELVQDVRAELASAPRNRSKVLPARTDEFVQDVRTEVPATRSGSKALPSRPEELVQKVRAEAPAPSSGFAELVRDFSPLPSLPSEGSNHSDGNQHAEVLTGDDRPIGEPTILARPSRTSFRHIGPDLTSLGRPEPELPPTPTQRGIPDPVVTTPPTGIHDTPSKRARRNKALSAKLKSSPLKPKDPAPAEPSKEKDAEQHRESHKGKEAKQPREVSQKPKTEVMKRRKSARFLIPEDPHAATKKARDDLLAELQQLQADVALANQENDRLHRQTSAKGKGLGPAQQDGLIAMLVRAAASEQPAQPRPKSVSIFHSINAFLPFQPRRKPAPLLISEKPLPSHLPIALDNPLPYLQAFSPLTYSSTITLLPRNASSSEISSQDVEQPVLRKHITTASHPSGLFATRFAMTVDTSALSISSIDILRLDMNAEKELGTFIRARARDTGSLGRDITVICWAMSRWVEVSIKRAQFWCTVEYELGTPGARIASFRKKRKRKRLTTVLDDEGDEDDNEKMRWTRKQMLPHFGRSSMELSNDEVDVRLEWKITFDWTGEVESSIGAAARLPRIWQEADERRSLDKIPETFSKLQKEKGPLGAARAIVQLLMPA